MTLKWMCIFYVLNIRLELGYTKLYLVETESEESIEKREFGSDYMDESENTQTDNSGDISVPEISNKNEIKKVDKISSYKNDTLVNGGDGVISNNSDTGNVEKGRNLNNTTPENITATNISNAYRMNNLGMAKPEEIKYNKDKYQPMKYKSNKNKYQTRKYKSGKNRYQPRKYKSGKNKYQPKKYKSGKNRYQPTKYEGNKTTYHCRKYKSRPELYKTNTTSTTKAMEDTGKNAYPSSNYKETELSKQSVLEKPQTKPIIPQREQTESSSTKINQHHVEVEDEKGNKSMNEHTIKMNPMLDNSQTNDATNSTSEAAKQNMTESNVEPLDEKQAKKAKINKRTTLKKLVSIKSVEDHTTHMTPTLENSKQEMNVTTSTTMTLNTSESVTQSTFTKAVKESEILTNPTSNKLDTSIVENSTKIKLDINRTKSQALDGEKKNTVSNKNDSVCKEFKVVEQCNINCIESEPDCTGNVDAGDFIFSSFKNNVTRTYVSKFLSVKTDKYMKIIQNSIIDQHIVFACSHFITEVINKRT